MTQGNAEANAAAGRIAVEVHGNGDPVVMVHGLGGTSNIFTPQVDALARYFKVIRPDLPGSGRTQANGRISIHSLVDSVVEVMEQSGVGSAHLVGHSMGTIVCQHLAVRHPAKVQSLALIGPLAAPPDAARSAIRDRAAKARNEGMAGIADAIVQAATSACTKAARPEAAAFVRELLMRQPSEGYALSCDALADAQAADVSGIGCPVLLITGSDDVVSPPPAVRALASQFKDARLTILNACGHWTTLERPSEVTEALLNFYLATI